MLSVGKPLLAAALLSTLWAGPACAEFDGAPDVEITVLEPPVAIYPALANFFRVPGYCDVKFAVSPRGLPVDIQPFCSHVVFCQPAREGVGRARFTPAERNGVAVRRGNIVYPMIFTIDGVPPPENLDLQACTTPDIS